MAHMPSWALKVYFIFFYGNWHIFCINMQNQTHISAFENLFGFQRIELLLPLCKCTRT